MGTETCKTCFSHANPAKSENPREMHMVYSRNCRRARYSRTSNNKTDLITEKNKHKLLLDVFYHSVVTVNDNNIMDVTEQQQIVKVKVQSSEDVNDPAMKAAILDQINQKLMEMGMTGTFTLKWRKQSDGEVFYKEKIEEKTLQ
ncbi:hypothetical protein Baya_15295 [Bagarius yarrelli]|uniref:Uncharacterized protein n=1 Tax=Bagarius yarrelli TaxID=175774 RepID=A0A556VU00_BAGYA|nr:hypothetical protein Baya_15295 [Bagarius yarrelli]